MGSLWPDHEDQATEVPVKVILTFDLKEGDDYDAAYEVLKRIGLHRITPN